ncbi:MAG TPA: hypothetical protein VJT73_18800 [Polyangiaceae bacterium]|nr:hypothetical protein [Polyangiaceae bacterium]
MMWRRVRAVVMLAGAFGLSWLLCGCNSPTLPLPPPEESKLQFPSEVELLADRKSVRIAGDGAVRWQDAGNSGVFVLMLNVEVGHVEQVVQPDAFGHYEGVVPVALTCERPTNHVLLWQRRGVGPGVPESEEIVVTVPRNAPAPSSPEACGDGGDDSGPREAGEAAASD